VGRTLSLGAVFVALFIAKAVIGNQWISLPLLPFVLDVLELYDDL
jgi:hypothetical protein